MFLSRQNSHQRWYDLRSGTVFTWAMPGVVTLAMQTLFTSAGVSDHQVQTILPTEGIFSNTVCCCLYIYIYVMLLTLTENFIQLFILCALSFCHTQTHTLHWLSTLPKDTSTCGLEELGIKSPAFPYHLFQNGEALLNGFTKLSVYPSDLTPSKNFGGNK